MRTIIKLANRILQKIQPSLCLRREIKRSRLFDCAWYVKKYKLDLSDENSCIDHYIHTGSSLGYWPNQTFDPAWYKSTNFDLVDYEGLLFVHYIKYGMYENRKPCPLFDPQYYLDKYPDVKQSGVAPYQHYVLHGCSEGRNPSIYIETVWYRAHNSKTTTDPIGHVIFEAPLGSIKTTPYGIFPAVIRNYCEKIRCIKDETKISFEHISAPIVSIIIPVYGKIDYTLMCLKSIAKNRPAVPFEILVVNDCSPDDTQIAIEGIPGLYVINNKINMGFIRSCNEGARVARGKYLHFINNDTKVTYGWLDNLLSVLLNDSKVGLVGSKLVYPDGRLQEAGGIIWQDGSAWNYGRFQDPDHPAFNYLRKVDYCSGASILLEKSLFEQLGMFDEIYCPAYCEDSDLALKVRNAGLKVMYQPSSVVVHYEGITSGTDENSGVKKYQSINNKTLFQRWSTLLQENGLPANDLLAAVNRGTSKRVLVIDACLPTPDQDAGSVTAINLMLILKSFGFHVVFVPDHMQYDFRYTSELQNLGIEALYGSHLKSIEDLIETSGATFDLFLLIRPMIADKYIKLIRKFAPNAKVLFETADLHFLRLEREAELTNSVTSKIEAVEHRQIELQVMKDVDLTIIRSEDELTLLNKIDSSLSLVHYPLMLDSSTVTANAFEARSGIAFIGGFRHKPNVDAVDYFMGRIYPLVLQLNKDIDIYIVGSHPPESFNEYKSSKVHVVGFVQDLLEILEKVKFTIAPLRYGAGVKGKVGTSMIMGVPVLATPIAVEGMAITDGHDVIVRDSDKEFAAAIVDLHSNEQLWNSLRLAGIASARNLWGEHPSIRTMEIILETLGYGSMHQIETVKFVKQ